MAYPNIIGRGGSYVVTDDHSGGMVFPREPRGNIRVVAKGRGVRGHKYGFQRDQQGGNRIPQVGLERRAIGLGHRVSTPAQPVSLGRPKGWQAMVADGKPVKATNCRPGAVAKRDAAAKRDAIKQRNGLAVEFNNALRSVLSEYNIEKKEESRRIAELQKLSLQQALELLAGRLNNGIR